VALLLHTNQGCAPFCWVSYHSKVPLPADSASLDCTVAFQGPSGNATFDCPSPVTHPVLPGAPNCTAPAGLKTSSSYYVYVKRGNVTGDDPQGYFININPSDGNDNDATNLKNWLGGNDFSVTVSCGGSQVAQLKDQSFGQTCAEGS